LFSRSAFISALELVPIVIDTWSWKSTAAPVITRRFPGDGAQMDCWMRDWLRPFILRALVGRCISADTC
jgi:hypothetical protein